jgi:hypothetical protein
MKTPILGSSYVARSVNAADNRMVNLFPEIVPEGGKEAAFLQRAPGLRFLQTVGSGPIRGLWTAKADVEQFFVVSGVEVYKLTGTTATPVLIGEVSGTGPVSIADNGAQIFFACNGPSYIYNIETGAFGPITDPDFPGAVTVSFLDGYFVFNEPNSQKIWVTALLDGYDINGLDFASAEGSPDGLVAVSVDHREAWLFGTDSIEVWYDAGLADFPLTRIQGAFNELGLAAAFSVAKLDNTLFWLGRDDRGQGMVYRANGYRGERVSTHAVEWQIQQYPDISDAIAYSYQQDGHSFYVLTFPSGNATWVYDVATRAWHERAGWSNGHFTRHRSNCQCNFNGAIVVGDYQNGNIYRFDLDVYADNGQIQRWLRSWRAIPTGQNNLNRSAHHSLQLDAQTGHYLTPAADNQFQHLATEANGDLLTESENFLSLETLITVYYNPDPQFMLRWSDDGGHTWSNEHWRGGGSVGEYGRRIIWRRLGMTLKLRDRVYEVSGTDPIKIAIMGAELHVQGTNA